MKKKMSMGQSFGVVMVPILVLLTFLSACSSNLSTESKSQETKGNSADKVTLRFLTNAGAGTGDLKILETRIEAFHKMYPNIKINKEVSVGEELKTKIKVDAASNNFPDVMTFWVGNTFVKPLTEAGFTLDVDEYFKATTKVKRSDFSDSMWEPIKIDGKNYIIPTKATSGFLLYNKEIFAKYNLTPPKDFEELKQVSKTLRDNGIIPFAYGSQKSIPGHFLLSIFAFQYENGIADSLNIGTTYKFDTPAFRNSVKMIDEMRKLKMFPDDTIANGTWDMGNTLYGTEKAAMYYAFPWTIQSLISAGVATKSGFMDWPQMPGSTVDAKKLNISGAQDGIIIGKKAFEDKKKREAIINFVDFMLDDEYEIEIAKIGTPPAKTVDLSKAEMDPFVAEAFSYNNGRGGAYLTKTNLPSADVLNTFEGLFDQFFAGVISPDEFINKVQESLDKAKAK
jgi:raffinose/stachyose/melibiose transport system substrate-binding protein